MIRPGNQPSNVLPGLQTHARSRSPDGLQHLSAAFLQRQLCQSASSTCKKGALGRIVKGCAFEAFGEGEGRCSPTLNRLAGS